MRIGSRDIGALEIK